MYGFKQFYSKVFINCNELSKCWFHAFTQWSKWLHGIAGWTKIELNHRLGLHLDWPTAAGDNIIGMATCREVTAYSAKTPRVCVAEVHYKRVAFLPPDDVTFAESCSDFNSTVVWYHFRSLFVCNSIKRGCFLAFIRSSSRHDVTWRDCDMTVISNRCPSSMSQFRNETIK